MRASLYDEMMWWLANGEEMCDAQDDMDGLTVDLVREMEISAARG